VLAPAAGSLLALAPALTAIPVEALTTSSFPIVSILTAVAAAEMCRDDDALGSRLGGEGYRGCSLEFLPLLIRLIPSDSEGFVCMYVCE